MKSVLAVMILFLALPLAVAGQSVTLVSPHAGENYPRGGSTRIIWQYSNLQGIARLVLFNGNTNMGVIQDNLPLTQQKFFWTVGQYEGKTAAAGSGYHIRIRVSDPVHGLVIANGPAFNIGPEQIGTMTVTNPIATSNWSLNQTHNITWTKSAGTHSTKVSIRLFRGDVFYRWVTISTDNDGVFEWFVPTELGSYKNNRLEIQSIYTSAQSPFFGIGLLSINQFPLQYKK